MELILYNQGNIYGINGYLKLMVSDFILIILIYLDVKNVLVYIVDLQKKIIMIILYIKEYMIIMAQTKIGFNLFLKFLKIN